MSKRGGVTMKHGEEGGREGRRERGRSESEGRVDGGNETMKRVRGEWERKRGGQMRQGCGGKGVN